MSVLQRTIKGAIRVCFLAIATSCIAPTVRAEWQVGVAKVNITPTAPMPMAGYASRGADFATGKLNDLWAKAILLDDGQGNRGLLVTMDLCGIDNQLSALLCERLINSAGLKREQIILSVSHTHSGPVVAKNLRPMHYAIFDDASRKLVDDYANNLVENVVTCALQARDNLKPSRLSYTSGKVTFATNRRNNPADSVDARRSAGLLAGPVDHSLPVLAVFQEDKLIATVFGYACHCTTLSGMEWSSDYAGYAQDQIEKELPGCTAMFWAGCGADQNPLPRRSVDLAQAYGHQLAGGVMEALKGVLNPIEPKLSTRLKTVELPFASLPTEQQLENDSQSQDRFIASRAQQLLSQVRAGDPLKPTYSYPAATWKLGKDLIWVSLGGEVVVDYVLAIKAAAEVPEHRWVMAYAHDVMAYIPSRRVLAEGGYEGGGAMVYYGLPSPWAPEVESLILDQVTKLIAEETSTQVAVFPVGARAEMLQKSGAGEGPLWDPQLGLLTSGDGHVMLRSKSGKQSVFIENAGTNGLGIDNQHRLVMCQNIARRIARREADGTLTVLTDHFEGHRYNQPNDLTFDSRGRIYFTDPKYGRIELEIVDDE